MKAVIIYLFDWRLRPTQEYFAYTAAMNTTAGGNGAQPGGNSRPRRWHTLQRQAIKEAGIS